jgi:cell division protein FtsI (penicillin-binding protein 3)
MKKSSSNKSVPCVASPILPFRLPVWRSKVVVFMLSVAFLALVVRAFWIQGPGNAFYRRQGERRYEHTLAVPATRGRILDRNGLVLATSLPVRAIWMIPDTLPEDLGAARLATLSELLDMTPSELRAKLYEDRTFVYIKRQVPIDVASKVAALDIPGIYETPEYRRL